MTPPQAVRRVSLVVALLFLVGLAWTGLSGGLNQFSQSQSTGQKAQTFSQLAYGVFALLGVVTTFWGRRWNPMMLGCWAVSVTAAAGLASVVWGETGLGIGLLTGGATLLIAVAIVWLLRVGARGLPGA